jgi:hypothetical protein
MTPRGDEPSLFDDREGPDLTSPGEGFELYRHKDAEKIRTRGWHGYYWARRTEQATTRFAACPQCSGSTRCREVLCPRRVLRSTTRW